MKSPLIKTRLILESGTHTTKNSGAVLSIDTTHHTVPKTIIIKFGFINLSAINSSCSSQVVGSKDLRELSELFLELASVLEQ